MNGRTWMFGRGACALALSLLVVACREKVLPEPDFERMERQEKYTVWEPCEFFADGRTAQHPPDGTVAADHVLGPPGYVAGVADGRYVDRVPIPLSIPLVQRGRQHFETFCAPCHGIVGDGRSRVASNMLLRQPPSLIGAPARELAPGRLFQVITEGYGLMPRYSEELPAIDDRWGVVAYIAALQKSRGVQLASLPPPLRSRAEEELE